MDRWSTVGGLDWLHADRAAGEPEEFGLLIGYGYVDETPAEVGIGAAALDAVIRALSSGEDAPAVGAGVGLASSTIIVRGRRASVRRAVTLLDGLLGDPRALSNVGASPRRGEWTGWDHELTAWCGAGSVSLAAATDEPWHGPDDQLRIRLRSLRPGHGRRTLAWTTDAEVVGQVLDSSSVARGPLPILWRDPSPTQTAGSVRSGYDNNLLSCRVPVSIAHEIAVRLLVRTVSTALELDRAPVERVDVAQEICGAKTLVALRAVPGAGETDWPEVHQAAGAALDALPDVAAAELDRELRVAVQLVAQRSVHLRALDAFGAPDSGARAERGDPRALTVTDLRAALADVRAHTLLSVPDGADAPADRPLFSPPVLAPVEPKQTWRARFDLRGEDGAIRPQLEATADRLQVVVVQGRRRSAPRDQLGAAETAVVDLAQVAFRRDIGAERTEVTDRAGRMVGITWPAYGGTEALRALLDERVPIERRITRPSDPLYAANLRKRLTRWRIARVLLPVALLMIVVIIVLRLLG